MATLLFIDTNIWLDFYRLAGRQSDLSILDRVDENRDHVISTVQVEMEFKKNRPRVILETHRLLKPPEMGSLKLPAYLARSRQSSGLEAGAKKIKSQINTLRERTENVLRSPTRYDPVYKVAQRVFRATGAGKLHRDHKSRDSIRRLAMKRFMLGYPPRKANDTSIGDAVNWEWIVRCAIDTGHDVAIVSRDSDFGVPFGGTPHLNDWLKQEFAERVSRRRTITLTDRLAEGLKRTAIPVSKAEEASEEEFLKTLPEVRGFPPTVATSTLLAAREAQAVLEQLNRTVDRDLLDHVARVYAAQLRALGLPVAEGHGDRGRGPDDD